MLLYITRSAKYYNFKEHNDICKHITQNNVIKYHDMCSYKRYNEATLHFAEYG